MPFTQILAFDGILVGLDNKGDLWFIQVHPHSVMNPHNTTRDGWAPTLYATKPQIVMATSS